MESQRGKSFAMDQESLLRGYLSSKTKTDNPYLAVVHRLDRPVAGVMVYAKTKKAAADLSAQLQTENFSKKYEAVVSGIVPACEGRLEDYLTADKRTGTTLVSSKADPLAKKAVLTWKEIAGEELKSGEILLPYASSPSPEGGWHFLSIVLETGRHHQIRCQLAKMGCPIKGDLKYGAPRSNPDGSICLHARKVRFIHPVSKELIELVAPLPEGNLWKGFELL